MLGDAYGAAVVAALSKKELQAMDELNKKMKEMAGDDLNNSRTGISGAAKETSSQESQIGINTSPSTSSNGSRVEVEEVILVENSTDEEDEERKALNPSAV
eukprot:GFUD01064375.1.p1 GENE.GFUD01064375.1~~GFUD01064375.1.p1  ORF type:complete len:116 (-),score=48.60 GFUD01064375.1:7-309(-)